MAIQKCDVPRNLDRVQRDQLKRFEREIDALLEEQYAGAPLVVEFGWRKLDPKVRRALLERYRRAGWFLRPQANPVFVEFA